MSNPSGDAPRARRRRLLAIPVGVLLVALAVPASGAPEQVPGFDEYGFQGEGEARVRDVDAREGRVLPSRAQEERARALGATAVSWNDFGTPHVLTRHGGYLSGPREGSAVDVARAFVRDNAELFRLSGTDVDALEVVRDSPLYDSPDLARVYREGGAPENPDVAHVVLFQQRVGGLELSSGGQLTVGVQRDGRVAWISSSVTGDDVLQGRQRLSAADAVVAAAEDVGLDLGALTPVEDPAGRFTTFAAELASDV
jgi:extracellular elastinolytic metalloproteinase